MNKLNEGSWGYGSLQSDNALDEVGVFMASMIDSLKKQLSILNGKRTDKSWCAIGLIDYVMTMLISSDTLYKVNEDMLEILEKHYKTALEKCINDKEWQKVYSEPDELISSLKTCQKTLKEYIKLCDDDCKGLSSSDVPEQSDSKGLEATIYDYLDMNESINPELKIEKIPLKYYDNFGYYYIDENVIGFDTNTFPSVEMVDKTISSVKKKYGIDIDKSDLKLIDTADIDNFTDVIDYEDIIVNQINDYYDSEEFATQKALHTTSAEEKRNDPNMKKYLKDRDQNISKKLTMQNGKEMPFAQWKALHSTSENKIHKK